MLNLARVSISWALHSTHAGSGLGGLLLQLRWGPLLPSAEEEACSETESPGRGHTSTCTVAVLPEVEEVQDINIDKNDLRVDTFRASGAGGQHVNKTDSAVRLTHIPSGLVVECQDGRSQHKNKEKALSLLAAKLKQQEIDNQQETIASERKIE